MSWCEQCTTSTKHINDCLKSNWTIHQKRHSIRVPTTMNEPPALYMVVHRYYRNNAIPHDSSGTDFRLDDRRYSYPLIKVKVGDTTRYPVAININASNRLLVNACKYHNNCEEVLDTDSPVTRLAKSFKYRSYDVACEYTGAVQKRVSPFGFEKLHRFVYLIRMLPYTYWRNISVLKEMVIPRELRTPMYYLYSCFRFQEGIVAALPYEIVEILLDTLMHVCNDTTIERHGWCNLATLKPTLSICK